MNARHLVTGVCAVTGLILASCEMQEQGSAIESGQPSAPTGAIAVIHPTEGNDIQGTVSFEQAGEAVRVTGELRNLSPGMHGFHVHEYGDCSASDATSAGGHYAPHGKPHGAPEDVERHVGDLGNIEANAEGIAQIDMVDSLIALSGPNSILGRAVVVHQGEDDLESQPSGDAGPRVGCGVVGVSNNQ